MDIYNNYREGVCYNFAILSNALLYSIGYKTLFVYGFIWEYSAEIGIFFLGKLPVFHVFIG